MINVNFTDGVEVITSSTHLYQWDSNQEITISGLNVVNASVHFTTKKRNDAIVVTGKKDGDNLIADIPNILLEDDCDIIAYVHVVANNKGNTIKIVKIPKLIRQKPTDYQFTENVDIMTFERLENDFKDLSNEVHEKILDLDSYCNNLTQETQNTCNQILADANEEIEKIENNYTTELGKKADIDYVDYKANDERSYTKAKLNDFTYIKTVSADNVYVNMGSSKEVIIDLNLNANERLIGLAGYNISNSTTDGWGGSYATIFKLYYTSDGYAVSVRNLNDTKMLGLKIYLYVIVAKNLD